MSRQIEISQEEYLDAWIRYVEALTSLPANLRVVCPSFERFLSPASYTRFSSEPIGLSITGTERYKMLQSPYANTLLAVYAHGDLTRIR